MPGVGNIGGGGRTVANITHHLKGINFPASKQDLVNHAKKNGADEGVLKVLRDMEGIEYRTMADVMKAYGNARTREKAA